MMRLHLRIFVLLAIVFSLESCGGGNGNPASQTLYAQVTINWPNRTRDANAPSSALSAAVQIGATAPQLIDRLDTPNAYSKTYTLPVSAMPNVYNVGVTFYSMQDGAGSAVASANGSIDLTGGTGNLGTVAVTGIVSAVQVLPNQTVPLNSSVALKAVAYDSLGNDLAVAPGAIIWSQSSDSTILNVGADGYAKALAGGSVTILAQVDGIQSSVQTVSVSQPAAVSACTVNTYVPNYASVILNPNSQAQYKGRLMYWSSFPLTVSFVHNSTYTSQLEALAQQALTNWTNATQGNVTFVTQNLADPTTADITISFVPTSKIVGGDTNTVGLTSAYPSSTNSSVIVHSDVQIGSDLTDNTQESTRSSMSLDMRSALRGTAPTRKTSCTTCSTMITLRHRRIRTRFIPPTADTSQRSDEVVASVR